MLTDKIVTNLQVKDASGKLRTVLEIGMVKGSYIPSVTFRDADGVVQTAKVPQFVRDSEPVKGV